MKKVFVIIVAIFFISQKIFSLNGGAGYFMFGHNVLDIQKINSSLTEKGYSALSDNFFSFGGGGYAVVNNLIIGGEGHGLSSKEQDIGSGYKATLSAGYGFLNIGYVVFSYENFILYPLLGIGGAGMNLKISERTLPTFNDITTNPKRGVEITTGGILVSISLGMDYLLNLGNSYSATKGGIIIGLRGGYTWSPNYNWTIDGAAIPGSPDVGINGYFIRMMIGFGGMNI